MFASTPTVAAREVLLAEQRPLRFGSAENIAAGQSTAAAAMDSWMGSEGHRANILNCANTTVGVGIGHGRSFGTYWTQVFGAE